jgi:hypothetical protein
MVLTRDDDRLNPLLDGVEDFLSRGGFDYTEDWAFLFQAKRRLATGDRSGGLESMENARQAIREGCWSFYLGKSLSKKSRARFEGLNRILDHPLGALLSDDREAFIKDIEARCDAFDTYNKESIKKGRFSWLYCYTSMSWCPATTTFVALAERRGWKVPVEHYAIARGLLDASPRVRV